MTYHTGEENKSNKSRGGGGVGFCKISLKRAINHLIENRYFNVGNVIMKQGISIPMGIEPAPFWVILFLYSYIEE